MFALATANAFHAAPIETPFKFFCFLVVLGSPLVAPNPEILLVCVGGISADTSAIWPTSFCFTTLC
jgi:hypothetical protein